jgi:hypothetical protein
LKEITMAGDEDEVSPSFDMLLLTPEHILIHCPSCTSSSLVQSFYESLKMDVASKVSSKVEGFAFGVGEVNKVDGLSVGFDETLGPKHALGKDSHSNDIKLPGAMDTSGVEKDGVGDEVMELEVLTRNEIIVEEGGVVG